MNSFASNLAALFDQELQTVKDILVVSDQHGTYSLYGRFNISTKNSADFLVYDSLTKEKKRFSSLKNAATWCTLCTSKKWREARRLESLDLKLCSLSTDIAVHRRLLKIANGESKSIYATKLSEDSYKRRLILLEIGSFVRASKLLLTSKIDGIKQRNFKYK